MPKAERQHHPLAYFRGILWFFGRDDFNFCQHLLLLLLLMLILDVKVDYTFWMRSLQFSTHKIWNARKIDDISQWLGETACKQADDAEFQWNENMSWAYQERESSQSIQQSRKWTTRKFALKCLNEMMVVCTCVYCICVYFWSKLTVCIHRKTQHHECEMK